MTQGFVPGHILPDNTDIVMGPFCAMVIKVPNTTTYSTAHWERLYWQLAS